MINEIEFTEAVTCNKFAMSRNDIKRVACVGRTTVITTVTNEELVVAEDYNVVREMIHEHIEAEKMVRLEVSGSYDSIEVFPSSVVAVRGMGAGITWLYLRGADGALHVKGSSSDTKELLGIA